MKNIPIVAKFLSIISIVAIFVVGVAFYTTGKMRQVDAAYSDVFIHEARAPFLLSRANRYVIEARLEIAHLLMATNQEDVRKASAKVAAKVVEINDFFDQAKVALPNDTEIPTIKAAVNAVFTTNCADSLRRDHMAGDMSPGDLLAAQQHFLNVCETSFGAVDEKVTATIVRLGRTSEALNDHLTDVTNYTVTTTFVIILVGLLIVVGLSFFVIRIYVTAPLGALVAVMQRLAGGDNDVVVIGDGRKDEVGAIGKAVQVFKAGAIERSQLAAEAVEAAGRRDAVQAEREAGARELAHVVESIAAGLSKLSQGELVYRLENSFSAEYEKLRHDFNGAMKKLSETMGVVASNASAIESGTGEITTAADDLSRRTEQQAASLEQTAAALDQITATVRKTAEGAMRAREVVGVAKTDAERSGKVVSEAVSAMSGIETSSNQISQIISVIDEIAFQTNLLALNAGVEAARAGDAGRGFAVVASEVRALAQRSAEAAKEIKTLISASGQQVSNGVQLVGETGRALERIAAQVTEINGVVTEIAASAQEQSTALNEVNTAVNQMDQVTQQNAAMVEQTTAASHSLAHEAQELRRLIGGFNLGGEANATSFRQPASPGPRPVLRASAKRPALKSVGSGGSNAARKPQLVANDGWEEF